MELTKKDVANIVVDKLLKNVHFEILRVYKKSIIFKDLTDDKMYIFTVLTLGKSYKLQLLDSTQPFNEDVSGKIVLPSEVDKKMATVIKRFVNYFKRQDAYYARATIVVDNMFRFNISTILSYVTFNVQFNLNEPFITVVVYDNDGAKEVEGQYSKFDDFVSWLIGTLRERLGGDKKSTINILAEFLNTLSQHVLCDWEYECLIRQPEMMKMLDEIREENGVIMMKNEGER